MIKTENLVAELEVRGYEVITKTVVKNGVEKEGIMIITDSNVNPIVYTENYKSFDSVEDAVDNIIETIGTSPKPVADDVISLLKDSDYVYSHVKVAMQRISTEPLVKIPCEFSGIESYLYVDLGNGMTVKITNELLKHSGLELDKLERVAIENTIADSHYTTIAQALGMPFLEGLCGIYVLSNSSQVRGASAVLNKALLKEIADKHSTDKVVILPSSIHEVLVIPYDDNVKDAMALTEMAKSVNAEVVVPEEQLGDMAYTIAV